MAQNEIDVIINAVLGDKKFKKGVKSLNTDLNKVEKKSKSLFSKLKLGWFAAAAAVAGVVKGLGSLIKTASDAEETISKFETVFKSVGKEADAMANNLSNSNRM